MHTILNQGLSSACNSPGAAPANQERAADPSSTPPEPGDSSQSILLSCSTPSKLSELFLPSNNQHLILTELSLGLQSVIIHDKGHRDSCLTPLILHCRAYRERTASGKELIAPERAAAPWGSSTAHQGSGHAAEQAPSSLLDTWKGDARVALTHFRPWRPQPW